MSALSISQVVAMLCAGPIAQAIGILNLYFASAGLLVNRARRQVGGTC